MSEPRFVVTELRGYIISEHASAGSSRRPNSAFFVQDTLCLWRVMATFANRYGQNKDKARLLALATAECDRLNEWERAELARG